MLFRGFNTHTYTVLLYCKDSYSFSQLSTYQNRHHKGGTSSWFLAQLAVERVIHRREEEEKFDRGIIQQYSSRKAVETSLDRQMFW